MSGVTRSIQHFSREIEQAAEDNIGKLRFCVLFRSGKCWKIIIGPKGRIESEKQVLPYIDKYEYFDKLSDNIMQSVFSLASRCRVGGWARGGSPRR